MLQNLLEQTYGVIQSNHNIQLDSLVGFYTMLTNTSAYEDYKKSLTEGLDPVSAQLLQETMDTTRINLLTESNSSAQLNTYAPMQFPIMRKFFPRLILPQLVTVTTMDGPEKYRYYFNAKFKKHGESAFGHTFPEMSTDVSRGPSRGVSTTATSSRGSASGTSLDILNAMSLTASTAHISRDFAIVGVTDGTTVVTVNIVPDIDGNFSQQVTIGSDTDIISGNINFETGVFTWSVVTGLVSAVNYKAFASLEENQITTKVRYEYEKVLIRAILRQLEGEWTIPMQQDVKALFKVDMQSHIASLMGDQLALDINKEIINDLFTENANNNSADHTDTFDAEPDVTFSGTKREWLQNIIYQLNKLSNIVHDDTQMGAANILFINPRTATVLQSLNDYRYNGDGVEGGELGYQSATINGGMFKVLISSVVPQNKIGMVYKSNDDSRVVYDYCPYIPVTIVPYPNQAVPTITAMTRYGKRCMRPEGIACLNISNI